MSPLPVVAIIGRPNVGKSTLFNRLTRSRDALVADLPGLTRDRQYGRGRVGDMPYFVVDTGGFEPDSKSGVSSAMARQTRQAVVEANRVLFIVDGSPTARGIHPRDDSARGIFLVFVGFVYPDHTNASMTLITTARVSSFAVVWWRLSWW